MHLNTIKPAKGSKKTATRVGRGIGSGLGKTAGRGHKGQHARAGGYHKVGFEGGQMPLQRRLPKFGFTSLKQILAEEVRVTDLNKLTTTEVTLNTLKEAGLISLKTKTVKIFDNGQVTKALTIKGLPISKGAKQAVQAAGGKVEV